MAYPASFEESNAFLGAPEGMTEEECSALSILRTIDSNDNPVVISCWKLTQDELKEINETGRVWLGIMGHTMPPAYIAGQKPFASQEAQ